MNSKRELLTKIGGIGTVTTLLPNYWIKPVVNYVILPTHAQTSSVFGFGKYSDYLVCIDFIRKDNSVFIEGKISSFTPYTQGSIEVSLETFNKVINNTDKNQDSRIQIYCDKDCNGNEASNPIDSIFVENILGELVIYGVMVEKYVGGVEIYPGACEFDGAECTR